MSQGVGNNSAQYLLDLATLEVDLALPPEKAVLTDDEREWFDAFVSARLKEDWRPVDLALLVKVVRLETKIRQCEEIIDRDGLVIIAGNGAPIVSPALRALALLQTQQLAMIRGLNLVQGLHAPASMHNRVKKARQMDAILAGQDVYRVDPDDD